MKPYDLVIENSLEKLIETVNIAKLYGYEPIGGMLYIESQEKFIQTININLNKINMKPFFTELAELLPEGQQLEFRIRKTVDGLTVMSTPSKGKIFSGSGTAEEFDQEFMNSLRESLEKKGFSFDVIEASASTTTDEEEEEEADDKKEVAAAKGKETKKAPVKKETLTAKARKGVVSKPEDDHNENNPDGTVKENLTVEEKIKVEVIAETKPEPKTEDNKAALDNEFKSVMHEGKRLFGERKYSEALSQFNHAKELKPGNAEAIMECTKAEKWVKAMAEL